MCTEGGQPLTMKMVRGRFEGARTAAGDEAKKAGKAELAARVEAFQFRDIRPKAASEITSLEDASKLLGHTDKQITQKVYRRVGELVKPNRHRGGQLSGRSPATPPGVRVRTGRFE